MRAHGRDPLLPVLAAGAIAGCGGGDGAKTTATGAPPAAPGSGAPSGQQGRALQAFAACLKRQGIAAPDPSAGGQGGPPAGFDPRDPKVRSAIQKCRAQLPQGAPTPPGGMGGGAPAGAVGPDGGAVQ